MRLHHEFAEPVDEYARLGCATRKANHIQIDAHHRRTRGDVGQLALDALGAGDEEVFELGHVASQQATVEAGGFAQLIIGRGVVVEFVAAVGGFAAEGLELRITEQKLLVFSLSIDKPMQRVQDL